MLPIPRPSAIAAFVGCVAVLAVGIGTRSAEAVVLAGAGLAALALALAASMPLGRRVRRERLEFAWWLGQGDPAAGGGAVVPSAPFEVRCYIRHRGADALLLGGLKPIVPGGAKVLDAGEDVLVLGPRARTEFAFRLSAPAAGRVVLHGLAVALRGPLGLFELPLYFPNPLAIKVLPRAARVRNLGSLRAGLSAERSGKNLLRRRGGGTELYELREQKPGDPFKSIAWKASARIGKLMVREVEQEVQETKVIVLDVSGSMRGGAPGARKLDFAIEAAAAEARRALDGGDRVGLLTVDGRVLGWVPPRDGVAYMIQIYDALLSATEVVDEDLTDLDDDEVVAIVGRYVRSQDGVDYSLRAAGGTGAWDVPALVRHVRRAVEDDGRVEVVAHTPAGASLRRFCRARGIPLPYRPDPRDGAKAVGLAAAIRRAGGDRREPRSIVIVTDFDGSGDLRPLVAAVELARGHGHSLSFVVPDAASFAPEPKDDVERDLHQVYALGEARRVREARVALGRLGASVVVVARAEGAGMALSPVPRRRVA